MKTLQIECKDCEATGIYVGMAERDGAAIPCRTCEGTGSLDYSYKEFTKRKTREDIKKVFPATGIVVSTELEGGTPYERWQKEGLVEGLEAREHTCPAWVYGQELDIWENKCKKVFFIPWGKHYSDCPAYPTKTECWKQYDEDRKNKK